MNTILRLDRVSKRYGALVVMDDLTIHLAEGEALGVIGPNGAGKTSMLNVIAGSIPADHGSVFFEEKDITKLPSFERCRRGIARSVSNPASVRGYDRLRKPLRWSHFRKRKTRTRRHTTDASKFSKRQASGEI